MQIPRNNLTFFDLFDEFCKHHVFLVKHDFSFVLLFVGFKTNYEIHLIVLLYSEEEIFVKRKLKQKRLGVGLVI